MEAKSSVREKKGTFTRDEGRKKEKRFIGFTRKT